MPDIEYFKIISGLLPTLFIAALVESYIFRVDQIKKLREVAFSFLALSSFAVGEGVCLSVIASNSVSTLSTVVVTSTLGFGGFILLAAPIERILADSTERFRDVGISVRRVVAIAALVTAFSPVVMAIYGLVVWFT